MCIRYTHTHAHTRTHIDIVLMAGDDKKIEHLLELEGAKERLQLMKADLTEEGSFDDAVMGCEGVFHTANPVIACPMSDPKAC